MLLSPDVNQAADPVLHALRSLIARGRHAEADQLAKSQTRRLPARKGHAFLALRADIALGLGRFAVALDWIRQALRGLDVCDTLQRSLEGARIRALIGLGRFREAEDVLRRRSAFLDPGAVELSLFQARVALHSGRLDEAVRASSQACEGAILARQRGSLVEALLIRARAGRERGAATEARRDLDRAQRLSNGLRDASALALVLSDRADLLAHQGDWAEAARDASQSGRLFARTFSPHEHLTAGRRTGLLGLAQGDPAAALPCIEKAADVARRGFGTTDCRAQIDLLLADAQLAGRNPEGALERATAALAFYRHAQDPGGLARAHVRRSLAALSASNMALALREARIAGAVQGAGPVAEGLSDLALGRVLLRKEPSCASRPFERAARNPSLYPPLRHVATLGAALASGASPESDQVRQSMAAIETFGDRRIVAIVRTDLREMYGIEGAETVWLEAASDNRESCDWEDDVQRNHARQDPGQQDDDQQDEEIAEFLPGLIGASPVVADLGRLVSKAAPHDLPVSIYGETGTGKEKVASALHELSKRSSRKFVAINAASLSDELFESQLFGHVRGSFTGAQTDRPGLVEEAKGGTLFIDEVADLSAKSQIRLLRFLQDGKYRRVGENQERQADVRIIVAANQPLQDLVKTGRFREDLMYRVQGLTVVVPPLRDRGRDVIHLARYFVEKASGGRARLSQASERALSAHSWPGNVREMEQEMRLAVVLGDSPCIDWRGPANRPARPAQPQPRLQPQPQTGSDAPRPASLHEALGGFERTFLKSVLSKGVERGEAARLLGISRQALHQKILRHGL